ncbi:MAG: hypothetical protein PUC37_06595 [Spirochaetales bacterium]|nr:hypothetical protein [Spirochaetales bacterium]
MEELDEEEKKRRKEQIEYRNKKRNSNLFTFLATIFEIIETAVVVFLFIILSIIIIDKIDVAENVKSILANVLFIASFFGGLFLGFFIFKKVVRFVICKFNLEDKLLDSITVHYLKSKEDLKEEQKQKYTR